MRATLILVLSTAIMAACGSSTGPSDENGNNVTPTSVSAVPDGPSIGGHGAGGGEPGPSTLPNDGVTPPCLSAIRLASDLLPGPVSCRR